ncbi:MAG TPA: serine/threonine-protein kinase, partial [Polyangiaceae bacterium]
MVIAERYRIIEQIGRGGMGVVYRAEHARIGKLMALKLLAGELTRDREQVARFKREALLASKLSSPNTVQVFDFGTSETLVYLAMEYLRGEDLSRLIRRQGPLGVERTAKIVIQICASLGEAHEKGIVHRDLKPENVMLGDFGEVLVMDWGLAMSTALFRKADSITQTSSMGGTPAYMAPEMATGPVDRIGPASDVYLLGAILFEIITGKPPHTGKNVMNCLFAAAKNEIQPTEHSGELLEIALRAMSTSPADRPATVQDFQNGIRTYQSHSESIVLSSRAEEDLARAEKSGDYQVFSRALFAFQEAYALWDGNAKAKSGISSAKLAYAKQAMAKEDFDLGASLLDAEDPSH